MYHSPPGSLVYCLAGSGKLICYRILKGLIEKKIIIKQPVYLLPFLTVKVASERINSSIVLKRITGR
jgi:hypothetical protein